MDSLRSQLVAGAIGLLAVTVTVISSMLIESERRILTAEIEKSVILQGRNIALASEKAFLRSDPEFELYPLVTRMSEGNEHINSITITDSSGILLGGVDLQHIAQKVDVEFEGYPPKQSPYLEAGESLYETSESFFLQSPVKSFGRTIGFVYMEYSKHGLRASLRRAITMTVVCGLGALFIATMMALQVFRRISRPISVLLKGVNCFGRGELETRIPSCGSREFRVLAGSFNEMAERIVEAQEELIDKKVTDRELEVAHDIQTTLIPANIAQPRGFSVGLHYKAARQVGGDYIDVIPVDGDRTAFVVADVSGKGIPGLVVMAMMKIMLHETVRKVIEPREVVRHLNAAIAKHLRKNMFVTMFLGVLDAQRAELRYSCAGHVPTVLYRSIPGRAEFIRVKVPPLGFLSDDEFCPRLVEGSVEFSRGDVILQYTDGLIESMNNGGDMFGCDRLLQLCQEHASRGAQGLVDAVLKAEGHFRGEAAQRDDLSLLCVGFETLEPVGAVASVKGDLR
ncbi:MAG: SpoIIE family protein phosphatase [Rubricoccaceae bacterium]|nr:SpoIIE family protein phosphatase [Rubricoccaceae bacterium]